MARLLLILLFIAPLPLCAQFVDASAAGAPASINGPWRFHSGDDPAWSSPSFDDSSWSLISADRPWNAQNSPSGAYAKGPIGYAWYRIRIKLPDFPAPLALRIHGLNAAADVFIDGRPIGTVGHMHPHPEALVSFGNGVLPIPDALKGRTVEISVRVWSWYIYDFLGLGLREAPQIGSLDELNSLEKFRLLRTVASDTPAWILGLLALAVSFFSLALFLLRPRAVEYVWAFAYLLTLAAYSLVYAINDVSGVSVLQNWRYGDWIESASIFATFFFIWSFLGLRRDRLFWSGVGLEFLYIGVVRHLPYFQNLAHRNCLIVISAAVATLIILVRLARSALQGNIDARLLLGPVILTGITMQVDRLRTLLGALQGRTYDPLIFCRFPFGIVEWRQVFLFLSLLAVGLILVLRFTRTAESEERLATEMEIARNEQRLAAQELDLAKQVQMRLLPQSPPAVPAVDCAGICLQARSVGGDYYDFLDLGKERFAVVVGDIAGKGMGAALLMANLQAALRSQSARLADSPEEALSVVNQLLFENTESHAYVTLFYAEYDSISRRLHYANCGHLPGLLFRATAIEKLEPANTVLGLFDGWEYSLSETAMNNGDMLVLYTDGVTEAVNDADQEFGEARLIEAVRKNRSLSARDLAEAVTAEVLGFARRTQHDDITMVVMKRLTDL